MAKIIVCPDSFKGSLDAFEVTNIITEILRSEFPLWEILDFPLADGGEGTAQVMSNIFPEVHDIVVSDPLGRPITTTYYSSCKGEKVFIESAKIIGLPLLAKNERNPMETSTRGLGEALNAAMDNGATDITISLGGSSTNDGGIGMLSALGYKFYDSRGHELEGKGKDLLKINEIIPSNNQKELLKIKFTILCDVDNPLIGENGASYVFAHQKGASKKDIPLLDEGLKKFCRITLAKGIDETDKSNVKGAGAAGGLGYSFISYLKAQNQSGIEYILQSLGFEDLIEGADMIITGEGKIDNQSLMGKVLSGILSKAKARNLPVIAIAGKAENKELLLRKGLTEIYEISDPRYSEAKNMEHEMSVQNLRKTIKIMSKNNIFKQFLL